MTISNLIGQEDSLEIQVISGLSRMRDALLEQHLEQAYLIDSLVNHWDALEDMTLEEKATSL